MTVEMISSSLSFEFEKGLHLENVVLSAYFQDMDKLEDKAR